MSLSVDGVWKAGVWATTVWADGVWREGAYVPPVDEATPFYAPLGGGATAREDNPREREATRELLLSAFRGLAEKASAASGSSPVLADFPPAQEADRVVRAILDDKETQAVLLAEALARDVIRSAKQVTLAKKLLKEREKQRKLEQEERDAILLMMMMERPNATFTEK